MKWVGVENLVQSYKIEVEEFRVLLKRWTNTRKKVIRRSFYAIQPLLIAWNMVSAIKRFSRAQFFYP